jgi:Na+/proline symporter
MIVIASLFAYAKVKNPDVRIIPVVLGIAALILGPMLGVFLLGMLTRARGSDAGNMIAITAGLAVTFFLGELHVHLANLIAPLFGAAADFKQLHGVPTVSFTWFALIGALVVLAVGLLFRTPDRVLDAAVARAEQARLGEDKPVALRD